MTLIETLNQLIHSIPVLPRKLQGTWLDRLWERIMEKREEESDAKD